MRDHFSEVVDRVERHHERVTVTRNGRPAAVLISPADLAELEKTLDVLSAPQRWQTSVRPTRPTRPATSSGAPRRSGSYAGE